jgi:hypothetical protein
MDKGTIQVCQICKFAFRVFQLVLYAFCLAMMINILKKYLPELNDMLGMALDELKIIFR